MAKKTQTRLAQPAELTHEQVAALTAGKARPAEIAAVLARHRQPRLPAVTSGSPKRSPTPLTRSQIEKLSKDDTRPPEVSEYLEASAPRLSARPQALRGERPTKNPPY